MSKQLKRFNLSLAGAYGLIDKQIHPHARNSLKNRTYSSSHSTAQAKERHKAQVAASPKGVIPTKISQKRESKPSQAMPSDGIKKSNVRCEIVRLPSEDKGVQVDPKTIQQFQNAGRSRFLADEQIQVYPSSEIHLTKPFTSEYKSKTKSAEQLKAKTTSRAHGVSVKDAPVKKLNLPVKEKVIVRIFKIQ